MTRCTEAGVYAEQFVETVVKALRAVVVGGVGFSHRDKQEDKFRVSKTGCRSGTKPI